MAGKAGPCTGGQQLMPTWALTSPEKIFKRKRPIKKLLNFLIGPYLYLKKR